MKRSKSSENSTPNYIDHDQKDPLLEEYEGLGNVLNIIFDHFLLCFGAKF